MTVSAKRILAHLCAVFRTLWGLLMWDGVVGGVKIEKIG
jgi:hypothetical protein